MRIRIVRSITALLVTVALLLTPVAGVALAKNIQCKVNKKCEGTRKADILFGTPGPDRMFGLRGNDTLLGFGGSDMLVGGRGEDTLLGGDEDEAFDTLDGGKGDDIYYVRGDWGDDTIIDVPRVDDNPMTGNSILFEGDITDALNITLTSGTGPEATDGTNTLNWENNVIDMLTVRGEGNDTVTGNSAANFLQILDGDSETGDPGGDDIVSGEGGNDRIRSLDQGGNDTVYGGEGDDDIDVQDGFPGDTVDCGENLDGSEDHDFALVDDGDTFFNCESGGIIPLPGE